MMYYCMSIALTQLKVRWFSEGTLNLVSMQLHSKTVYNNQDFCALQLSPYVDCTVLQ